MTGMDLVRLLLPVPSGLSRTSCHPLHVLSWGPRIVARWVCALRVILAYWRGSTSMVTWSLSSYRVQG